MDVSPAYKEGDEADEALFGETEDEAEDNAGSDESPLHWRRRCPAPPRPRGANNEAEDTAGSAEAPWRQQRGKGHRRLRLASWRRRGVGELCWRRTLLLLNCWCSWLTDTWAKQAFGPHVSYATAPAVMSLKLSPLEKKLLFGSAGHGCYG